MKNRENDIVKGIMEKISPIIKKTVNEAKAQQTLSIEDINERVDARLEEISIEDWLTEIRYAVRSRIQGIWEEEMQNSKHYIAGKGYVFISRGSSGVTKNPDSFEITKQTNRILKKLGI